MTIHVVIPVFNRLEMTQSLLSCLRMQQVEEPLHIVIVDDGSTDGTAEYLAADNGLTVLKGDGSLWWGGAVDLAVRHLQNHASRDDWLLLMNNDTTVLPGFIQGLLDVAKTHAPAAVGSVIRDKVNPDHLLSVGVRIDAWRIRTHDLIKTGDERSLDVIKVDALAGRGVLYPWASVLATGGFRPKCLPHYLADYEFALRVRRKGWHLLVTPDAAVYSDDDYGSTRRFRSLREKLFSVRSPLYLPALLVFWWEASTWPQRLTFPVRAILFALFPSLRTPAV